MTDALDRAEAKRIRRRSARIQHAQRTAAGRALAQERLVADAAILREGVRPCHAYEIEYGGARAVYISDHPTREDLRDGLRATLQAIRPAQPSLR